MDHLREANQHNNGEHVLDLLTPYREGWLKPAEILKVEEHLPQCLACQRASDDLAQIVVSLHNLPDHPLPRSFTLTPALAENARRQPLTVAEEAMWNESLSLEPLPFTVRENPADVAPRLLYKESEHVKVVRSNGGNQRDLIRLNRYMRNLTAVAAVLLVMLLAFDFMSIRNHNIEQAYAPVYKSISSAPTTASGSTTYDQSIGSSTMASSNGAMSGSAGGAAAPTTAAMAAAPTTAAMVPAMPTAAMTAAPTTAAMAAAPTATNMRRLISDTNSLTHTPTLEAKDPTTAGSAGLKPPILSTSVPDITTSGDNLSGKTPPDMPMGIGQKNDTSIHRSPSAGNPTPGGLYMNAPLAQSPSPANETLSIWRRLEIVLLLLLLGAAFAWYYLSRRLARANSKATL